MTLTILDPCTGSRVIIQVAVKAQPQRTRRQILRELDRIATQQGQAERWDAAAQR